ncbi:MAG: T9SS type A sorting domain-containing protein [Candidatus Zixiibacteriota bacterium]|nr:MAG: T9SS type A sorting domain-containing protein [candidate division Zixibacteria bacterium]
MKNIFILISALSGLAASSLAFINSEPDQTALWNSFNGIIMVDSFAVITAPAGIMVCRFDSSSGYFEPLSHTLLPSAPTVRKLHGDLLAVMSDIEILYFLDVSDLPDIELLGAVDVDVPILDFAVDGQDLYICAGFDGLFRYVLEDFEVAQFVDSSMIGVHIVDVELDGDRLYALDDYNGVITYDISGEGPAQYLDFLLLPIQGREVTVSGQEVVIRTATNDILIGEWHTDHLAITDSANARFIPSTVLLLDTLVFSVDQRSIWFDLYNRNSGEGTRYPMVVRMMPEQQIDLLPDGGNRRVVFPSVDGGLHILDLDRLPRYTVPDPAYDRPGPIRTVFFYDQHLFTGGVRNPLDRYERAPDSLYRFEETMFSGLDNVRAASATDNAVSVVYPQMESILNFRGSADDLQLDTTLDIDTNLTLGVQLNTEQVGEFYSMFGYGWVHLDVYSYSDTAALTKVDILSTLGGILDAEIMDSLLVISTNKSNLWTYRIYDDFRIEFRSTMSVGSGISDLVSLPADSSRGLPRRMIGFGGNRLLRLDLSDPGQPVAADIVALPVMITAATLEDGLLYGVGPTGLGVFSVDSLTPTLIDYGGRAGSHIAVLDGIAAISDGTAMHLFDLRDYLPDLSPAAAEDGPDEFALVNFPNPFNPSTTISYRLEKPAMVTLTVYNLLGQKVVRLVDRFEPAGSHAVVWNGKDEYGRSVASGLYFYRLSVGDRATSRKMLLVK